MVTGWQDRECVKAVPLRPLHLVQSTAEDRNKVDVLNAGNSQMLEPSGRNVLMDRRPFGCAVARDGDHRSYDGEPQGNLSNGKNEFARYVRQVVRNYARPGGDEIERLLHGHRTQIDEGIGSRDLQRGPVFRTNQQS